MKDANGCDLNIGDYVITWDKLGSSINTVDGIVIGVVDKGIHYGVQIEYVYDAKYKSKRVITKMPDKVIKAIKFERDI